MGRKFDKGKQVCEHQSELSVFIHHHHHHIDIEIEKGQRGEYSNLLTACIKDFLERTNITFISLAVFISLSLFLTNFFSLAVGLRWIKEVVHWWRNLSKQRKTTSETISSLAPISGAFTRISRTKSNRLSTTDRGTNQLSKKQSVKKTVPEKDSQLVISLNRFPNTLQLHSY